MNAEHFFVPKHFNVYWNVALFVMLAVATIMALPGTSDAQTIQGLESLIRNAMPGPARCERTSGPSFSCRYPESSDATVVLEIGAANDSVSGSLTYNTVDQTGAEYLISIKRFLRHLGVAEEQFEHCVRQSRSLAAEIAMIG